MTMAAYREPSDELLTMRQAGHELGVSRDTVRRMMLRGELAYVNMAVDLDGRPAYRVKRSEVEAIKQRRAF